MSIEIQDYQKMKILTNNFIVLWQHIDGIAPPSVEDKFAKAMLKWLGGLTDTLDLWINKVDNMTEGELILARVNLGALVECWLKMFYCAYYEDYLNEPKQKMKKGKVIVVEPEKLSFEELKLFGIDKLYNKNSDRYNWIDSVQDKRNSVHLFQYRDIGTPEIFVDDVIKYCQFVNDMYFSFPSIEDCIDNCEGAYPDGYQPLPIF